MAFKEIRQTLLVQIDFLANSPNFCHLRYNEFNIYSVLYIAWLFVLRKVTKYNDLIYVLKHWWIHMRFCYGKEFVFCILCIIMYNCVRI